MKTTILSIAPELYSTKIAISENEKIIYESEIIHAPDELILCENTMEQMPLRRDAIMYHLRKDNVDIKSIQYITAEGGLLRPCKSGVYTIDKKMVGDLIALKKQLARFLDFDSDAPNAAVLVNNYDWMKNFTFLDFIRNIALCQNHTVRRSRQFRGRVS